MSASHVLLAEDDEDIRQSISDLLTFAGYEVESVSNGAEALASLRKRPRACVVLSI